VLERGLMPREERPEVKVAVLSSHHPATEPAVQFTDTVMYQTPVIELPAEVRDSERILPPGAGGVHGGAYKMLRTQVLRRLDQLGGNTLGVMSSGSGEGKTLTAINLAIAIAADPARTAMLIDFDLRRPSIHRRFHYEPGMGVEDYLQQRCVLRDAMFKVAGYERLTVVAARGRTEHSSELLASARTAEMVAEMRSRYANRVLIFDIPPVLQADDALAFARNLHAGLLVIGERRTRRDDVTRALQLLGDLPFVGTVLNGAREQTDGYY
jgi:protein-tyrosine kinase